MGKIDINEAPTRQGSAYPPPFDAPCTGRFRWKLGDAGGLTQFGVNLMRLAPGAWSSQRHWHSAEDEFVWVVEGEVVLVTDEGERELKAGDCAAFPAGVPNGHHLQNRSTWDALVLEVGSRRPEADEGHYSDLDMVVGVDGVYRRRDGTPYEAETTRAR